MHIKHYILPLAHLADELILKPGKVFIQSDFTALGRVKVLGFTLISAYVIGKIAKFLASSKAEKPARTIGFLATFGLFVKQMNGSVDLDQQAKIVNMTTNIFSKVFK